MADGDWRLSRRVELGERLIDEQLGSIDAIQAKLSDVMAVMIALSTALFSLAGAAVLLDRPNYYLAAPLAFGGLLFGAVAFSLPARLQPGEVKFAGQSPGVLAGQFQARPQDTEDDYRAFWCQTLDEHIAFNEALIERLARAFRIAIRAAKWAMLVLALALVMAMLLRNAGVTNAAG